MNGDMLNYFLSLGIKISELDILSLGTRTPIHPWSCLGTYFELSECALSHRNICPEPETEVEVELSAAVKGIGLGGENFLPFLHAVR